MSDWRQTREALLAFALGLPEAYEDHPWADDTVVKVNKKIFVFLGTGEPDEKYPPGFGVKLREAHGHAMSVPGAAPSGYGLGKAGWVSVPFTDDMPDRETLCDWVEESYRIVAPKRLVARLDLKSP
jgi:predicted DNA-binding protein (MmcQ/YjbR family)